jgi:hypothetical protein
MSDIFISYATADRAVAQEIAKALHAFGWSVWWDRDIPLGKRFDQAINQALDDARCVLVLWSKAALNSDWVKDEATEALRRGVMLPLSLMRFLWVLGVFRPPGSRFLSRLSTTAALRPLQRLFHDC